MRMFLRPGRPPRHIRKASKSFDKGKEGKIKGFGAKSIGSKTRALGCYFVHPPRPVYSFPGTHLHAHDGVLGEVRPLLDHLGRVVGGVVHVHLLRSRGGNGQGKRGSGGRKATQLSLFPLALPGRNATTSQKHESTDRLIVFTSPLESSAKTRPSSALCST